MKVLTRAFAGTAVLLAIIVPKSLWGMEEKEKPRRAPTGYDSRKNHGTIRNMAQAGHRGNLEAVDQLLRMGHTINKRDKEGRTALYSAAFKGYKDMIEPLIARGADIHAMNGLKETPLHGAAFMGNTKTVKLLLERGADIDAQRADGQTPLHLAAFKDNTETAKLLIDHGADINIGDKKGQTPLHLAAFMGNIETVKLLIEKGGSSIIRNNRGETPLKIARAHHHQDIASFLQNHEEQHSQDSSGIAEDTTLEPEEGSSQASRVGQPHKRKRRRTKKTRASEEGVPVPQEVTQISEKAQVSREIVQSAAEPVQVFEKVDQSLREAVQISVKVEDPLSGNSNDLFLPTARDGGTALLNDLNTRLEKSSLERQEERISARKSPAWLKKAVLVVLGGLGVKLGYDYSPSNSNQEAEGENKPT